MPSVSPPATTGCGVKGEAAGKGGKREARRLDPEVPRHLWKIHGQLYDFADFMGHHPGGEDWIVMGRGRDCTELFESVHCLSNRNIASLLDKYRCEVQPENREEIFSWEEDGFYRTLVRRVRRHFAVVPHEDDSKIIVGNYKFTWMAYLKVSVLASLLLFCIFQASTTGSFMYAFFTGLLIQSLGLSITHDGSHGAISKRPFINRLGLYFGCFALWDDWIWMQHHVYGHHSYTGINRKDPDMNNARAFLRKHPEGRWKSFLRFQHLYVWPVLMLFPNQHFGQFIQYTIALFRGRVFGMPLDLESRSTRRLAVFGTLAALSVTVFLLLPWYWFGLGVALGVEFFVFCGAGVTYFLVVAPNHDSEENVLFNHPDPGKKVDWGEQQVRMSGDHSTSDSLLDKAITQLWGGMNYQIEHHLFPSVAHVHYPAIRKIVQKTCGEFNIPYHSQPTWLAAMKSYFRLVRQMGRKAVGE